MKKSADLADWPPHLHPIFAAIGKAMDKGQLQPAMLDRVSYPYMEDHVVTVVHISSERAKPAGNRYEVHIKGPTIDGQWNFRSGILEQLARAAAALT